MRTNEFLKMAEIAGFHAICLNHGTCEGNCVHSPVVSKTLVGSLVGLPIGNLESLERFEEMVIRTAPDNHKRKRATRWVAQHKNSSYWWFRVAEYQPA